MKRIWYLLIASLVLLPALRSDDSSAYTKWVGESLHTMQSVKEGMTRADLDKVFMPTGGLSSRTQQSYVYRGCPYFKVDVEFEPDTAASNTATGATDKITKVSKPYVEWPTGD